MEHVYLAGKCAVGDSPVCIPQGIHVKLVSLGRRFVDGENKHSPDSTLPEGLQEAVEVCYSGHGRR